MGQYINLAMNKNLIEYNEYFFLKFLSYRSCQKNTTLNLNKGHNLILNIGSLTDLLFSYVYSNNLSV